VLASILGPCRDVRPVTFMLRRATLLVMLAGCLLAPSLAHASGAAVIRDCEQHGQLTGHYSQADLNSALNSMPADLKEYSNCEEAVQQAQAAGASKPRSSKNSPTGTDSTSTGSGGGTSGGASGGGSSGAGSGSSPSPQAHAAAKPAHAATKADKQALKTAQHGRPVGAAALATTQSHATPSSDSGGSIPTPLLVVLILLGIGALVSLVVAGRRRSPRVRRVLARDRT
jgi:cobalamin biosynthesis Mg chelatase CobN